MMKRVTDVVASIVVLTLAAPLIALAAVLVWLEDRGGPFYWADRVGRGGRTFMMVKLRSMVVDADKTGVDSTSASDARVTRVGSILRRFKLDELPQFWNVLRGEMSIVGPRPNVLREVALYTTEERRLLDVRPGITDLASIVFADEGDILEETDDPDLAYNQLIRPWKSRLGLFYVDHRSLALDVRLIWLTLVAFAQRNRALAAIHATIVRRGGSAELAGVSLRRAPLTPLPPPGAHTVVASRTPAGEERA